MRVVLDASVAVNLVVAGPAQLSSRASISGRELVAPALVDTEVLSALARLERAGVLEAPSAQLALQRWLDLPCERLETVGLVSHIWALRSRIRIADAHYVALARALDAPLLTADRRLAAAVPAGVGLVIVT